MITAVRVGDPNATCVEWWPKVEWLKGRTEIEFKPGLNILWGPNGSGKSTVLRLIALMTHCQQGGRSVVTAHSIREVFGFSGDTMKMGAVPVHDGQCVMHFDPSHRVGLIGGAFDDDFFSEGIANNFASRASAGQQVLHAIGASLNVAFERKVPEIDWKVPKPTKKPSDKDFWAARAWQVAQFLQGTEPKGQPTVLLDEPDRSLSLKFQAGLWQNLAHKAAKNVQIIAASHSPFALRLPGVNYIETEPGYLDECNRVLDSFMFGMLGPKPETEVKPTPEPKPRSRRKKKDAP